MDLEKPIPAQASVGIRDSPSGFFCMAANSNCVVMMIAFTQCYPGAQSDGAGSLSDTAALFSLDQFSKQSCNL